MVGDRLDRAAAVREGEEVDLDRLRVYLARVLPQVRGDVEIEQFPSGFSNLTYLIRMGDQEFVLRRPPFGSKVRSAHDMGREFRVLSKLSEVFGKAPRPLAYCDDPEVLGAPFYVMERVEGVILRPGMSETKAPAADDMAAIGRALVEALVELHAVDFESAGLAELGKPEGYVRRQVEGWGERYRRARTDDVPELERAAAWLVERQPVESAAALIHNDFKYDNLVLDPDDPTRVRAVLDWEMATLGDPLMDLGTTLGYWVDPGDPPELLALQLSPTTLPGNPRRSEVAALYAERGGRDLSDLVFYYVYGLFKIAVIIQQIYYRYQAGHTTDPRFARLDRGVAACGVMAARAIDLDRIDRLVS